MTARNRGEARAIGGAVHSTPDARLALVCLLALAAVLVSARLGEARRADESAQHAGGDPVVSRASRSLASEPTGEGDRLRDGHGLDPNRASEAELTLLPGVGPRLARALIAERERRGGFRSLAELRAVRGIGDKKLAKLGPFLRFGSEGVEGSADAQADLAGADAAVSLEREAGAQVEPDEPGARGEVVEAEHDVSAGP